MKAKLSAKVFIGTSTSTSTLLGVCINLHVQFLGAAGSKANLGGPARMTKRKNDFNC